MAAVDYFLKIDGIVGESLDAKHTGEMQLESFSWGETQQTATPAGSGAGAGKVQIYDLHFVMRTNKASAQLLLACASGQHLKTAVLTARKSRQDATRVPDLHAHKRARLLLHDRVNTRAAISSRPGLA